MSDTVSSGYHRGMPTTVEARDKRRRRHEEVRARIEQAMLEAIAETPLKDVRVDDLASAAGLSRSAFYFYFRDKHDVLIALTQVVAAELFQEADRWWSGTGEPEALIREALGGITDTYARNRSVLRVVTEVSTYDSEVSDFWRAVVQRFVDATAEHLRGEEQTGRLRPGTDPERAAESLVWMSERCFYIFIADGDRRPEQVAETLTAVWMAALYREG
jgi:AcrR family transcriptional regulator